MRNILLNSVRVQGCLAGAISNNTAELFRVAAYARVSTDKDDQVNSFESQVKYFTEFIDSQENWQLVKVYSDDGITGTSTQKRTGFNSMIDDAVSRKIDFIITKEVSRFARNTVDTLQITRKLKDIGVGVYFMLDNINTLDKDGELRLTLMASLAQEESRKTSERVKWGQKRQMEKGVVFGRNLLGYQVKEGKLYLVEDEAEIVKLIFHKYLNEGKGTHIIARELKEQGIKPYDPDGKAKHKNDWSSTQILRVLRNEKYVGDLCQKKTYTQSYLDHKKRYNRGEEEMIYIKDHHPEIAIVSRETWNATQMELDRHTTNKKSSSNYSNRYWASGKIFCGICGEKFINKKKKTQVGTSNAWYCINRTKSASCRTKECHMSHCVNDKSLRSIVFFILETLLENKDTIKTEIINSIKMLSAEENHTGAIKNKLDRIENRKQKLIDMRLDSVLTDNEFKLKREQLEKEACELRLKLKKSEDADILITAKKEMINEIDKALMFNVDSAEHILKQVTEYIVVCEDHTLFVKLKDISLKFKVKFKTTGKLNNYKTNVLVFETVNEG